MLRLSRPSDRENLCLLILHHMGTTLARPIGNTVDRLSAAGHDTAL